MQRLLKNFQKPKVSNNPFASEFVTNPSGEINDIIIKKQLEILQEAIDRYDRLEDIKKFTKLTLQEMDNVDEDDIKRALELEEKISIDDDAQIQKLLESEDFINAILGEIDEL